MGDDQHPTEGDSHLARGISLHFVQFGSFYPCDTMAFCLSVRTRCSIIKGDEQIDLVLGMDVSFDQSYTVF